MRPLDVPVHVGSRDHAWWGAIEGSREGATVPAAQERPQIAEPAVDWGSVGIEPRWIGYETADCAAAVEPSHFALNGAEDFTRFRQGAAKRGEPAIVISRIGLAGGSTTRESPLAKVHSISMGGTAPVVRGIEIGHGALVRKSSGLTGADAQLALLLTTCSPELIWRGLKLDGAPVGTPQSQWGGLHPLVETSLGEPVAAVWSSSDGVERRYVVPAEVPWSVLLRWLAEDALPEFVPNALRRARHVLGNDRTLMSRHEREAREALDRLDEDHRTRRSMLVRELESAESAAAEVREGLLYGTGAELVCAVRIAFESAGITVDDVDELLGGTKNADLLCRLEARSRLVEVKSARGNPSERLLDDLMGHMREWPALPESMPIEGGALVVNHQTRRIPQDRTVRAYERPEFLAAQSEPIITTKALFDAWLREDHVAIREMLFPE